jgi:hypothetical protein
VVRPASPAARGHVGVLTALEQRRKRTQPEEQDQVNGEAATHLEVMVHDRRRVSIVESRLQVSSSHWLISSHRSKNN